MGWILMKPFDDKESQKATTHLRNTGECLFGLSKYGAILKPFVFVSRSYNNMESKYHFFTGKVAAGRWEIGQNSRVIWGFLFFWICDCSAVKGLIEYDGYIFMVQRWAQELMGYIFAAVHRPNQMMCDIDALSRRYGKLIVAHLCISNILHNFDARH